MADSWEEVLRHKQWVSLWNGTNNWQLPLLFIMELRSHEGFQVWKTMANPFWWQSTWKLKSCLHFSYRSVWIGTWLFLVYWSQNHMCLWRRIYSLEYSSSVGGLIYVTNCPSDSPGLMIICSASVSTNETMPPSCVLCRLQHFPPPHPLWYANEEARGFVGMKRLSTVPASVQPLSLLRGLLFGPVLIPSSVSAPELKKEQLTVWLLDTFYWA